MKRNVLIVLALILVLFLAGWTLSAARPGAQLWEYKFETNISEKKANQLAAQGWELVAIGSEGTTVTIATYVFKRPLN